MQNTEDDIDLVAYWTKKDPARWIAGVMAGLLAGIVAMAFAGVLGIVGGGDVLIGVKVGALPIMGGKALEAGVHMPTLIAGFVTLEALAAFLGFVFAHFAFTNRLSMLFGMGLTWAAFTWVFIINLFSQSFRDVFVADFSRGGAFFVCCAFGLSLTSVAFFDRLVRR